MLAWSFPRKDISRKDIARKIALALSDEMHDLEQAGISINQIDELTFREDLALKKQSGNPLWNELYMHLSRAAIKCPPTLKFTLISVFEFNDIITAIATLDADVVTIEASRAIRELLQAFQDFAYPNGISSEIWDIHSPNVPDISWIKQLD